MPVMTALYLVYKMLLTRVLLIKILTIKLLDIFSADPATLLQ